MVRLEESIEVERPRADCFRYLSDFSTCEQWDSGVYRAQKVTPGAPARGSEFRLVLDSAGRKLPMGYRLLSLNTDSDLLLRGEGKGFRVEDRISFTAITARRTRIDYRADLNFDGAMAMAEPVMRPFLERMGKKAVAGLRRALTPDQRPPAPGIADWLGYKTLLPAAWSFTERGYLAMPDKGLSEFMDGKTVAITGPTSGLGLAAACELARLGAELLLVGRNELKMQTAIREIVDFSGCDRDKLKVYQADLSLLADTRAVAGQIREEAPRLDVLINNAGALFAERGETGEGHERALAINLLSPWVLTETLIPLLQAGGGRVINVASGGMYAQPLRLDDMQYRKEAYDGSKAYARAKRGLVAATEYWAEKHRAGRVTFNSMHPGWAATPGVAKSLPAFNERMSRWMRDSRMGADTMVWLASARAVRNETGHFWFDRKPRPTAVLPGTRVTTQQRDQLIDWLRQL